MPGVYGGDDVSAIVIDPGSSLLRAGWAGEDTPRVVDPSSYAWIPSSGDDQAAATQTPSVAADGDVTMEDASTEANGEGTNGDSTAAAASEAQDTRTRTAAYLSKRDPSGKFKKRYFGDSELGSFRSGKEISPTVTDGVVSSVPDAFHLFNYAYGELGADPTEHPLLLTESTWNPRQVREDLTEMAFEGLAVPAFYLANQTVMSS